MVFKIQNNFARAPVLKMNFSNFLNSDMLDATLAAQSQSRDLEKIICQSTFTDEPLQKTFMGNASFIHLRLLCQVMSEMLYIFFLCITKKEVKATKKYKSLVIVGDGNRHPVGCRRAPSHTHKLRKKTYK